ncbi:MAG TPA: hypothetical protein VM120_10405, partial [Bryobacteraceae bacterium]|nr:hypothetical protein [Bryobacteraceae bacterium]
MDLSALPDGRLYHIHAMSDGLTYTIFPMLLVGFVTALLWQQLFPENRDYLILIPLPLSRLQMFAAKFSALTVFIGLFVTACNLFPSL